jgi:hypothetical protein
MNVALGLRVHSGWAALVVVGKHNGHLVIVERRRIELVENEWQKQPYHAAENLKRNAARDLVKRGITVARRNALREIRATVNRERQRENEVTACAVLVTDPMPAWSTEEILAVHFRMHKAEGALFRDALIRAAEACRLAVVAIPEKQLAEQAVKVLKTRANDLSDTIGTLGKSVGPPWGKDQKEATVAALVALQNAP